MMEQFSTVDESQYKIQLLGRLEGEFQGHDEGVIDLGQDGSLSKGMCDFRSRDDVCFTDSFQGVNPMCVLLPGVL